MAKILRVRRVSNPRRRKARLGARAVRRRNRGRRRLSAKQIRHFGTKAQKSALKRRRNTSRHRGRRNIQRGFYDATGFHPIRRSRDYDADRADDLYGSRSDNKGFGKPKARKKAKGRRRNPAPLVVTLGAANPRRRKVARRRRSRNRRRNARVYARPRRRRVSHRRRRRVAVMNPRRSRRRNRRHARRRNARVVYVSRRRRSNRRHHTRRNPTLFGASITSKRGLTLIGGGITGVVAAKFIPTMLPTAMLGSVATTSFGKVAITGVSAVLAGWAAGKFVGADFGEGVLFGGLMQTASVAINAFFPSVYSQLGIGLGDLMSGSFVVPQNPIRAAIPPPPPPNARVTMNGLARAYGAAF